MDREQILAFRLARCGLADRDAPGLAAAALPPCADFSRDAALLALAARRKGLTRDDFDAGTDSDKEIVVAYVVRGAIHALPADRFALLGRALLGADDEELLPQLGRQVAKLSEEHGFAPSAALEEVADATRKALARGRKLSKNELHEELRSRLGEELLPWCKGCESHHAPPMLWRFAGVAAGVRLDSERRYLLGKPGKRADPSDAVRLFLRAYAPATSADFAEWAGIGKPQAKRLWAEMEDELAEVKAGKRTAHALAEDEAELDSPPEAEGVVFIPPGDPYLWRINRPLLAPDKGLGKRLFRPVASPGVVLSDGRLAGTWKARVKGKRLEVEVEKLGRVAKPGLEGEAERIAALRGAGDFELVLAG